MLFLLASNSPRRRELLHEITHEFRVEPSLFEESAKGLSAYETVRLFARGKAASPIYAINPGMAPVTILHGDQDPLVTIEVSELFYRMLCEAGMEDRCDFYILKNGGHGTREFFQASTKKIIAAAFDRWLK